MDRNIDYSKVKEFVHDANQLISNNALEDVIRHNLSSWMRQMFKDNPWWISVHISGSETKMAYTTSSGSNRGFVDSLVGKTVIEYEKNLEISSIFNTGYLQVKDYCAGLLNEGVDKGDIIGVLSDTIRWYAYRISHVEEKEPDQLYAQDMIELEEIEQIRLNTGNEIEAKQFVNFIMRYIAREGSRNLDAINLAKDMGIESRFHNNYISRISEVIKLAFDSQKTYSSMIESLWSNFISYIGGNTNEKYFILESYINEFYIITLAKYLCVNILEGKNVVSGPDESLQILNGNYFKSKGILNLIEYDYFGWINDTPYAEQLLEVTKKIQEDLLVYDFRNIPKEDLFGPLVAQLAQREQRLLLGQEYTPQWLAKKMVEKLLESMPDIENPRFLDMCCGSGVFVVETIKQTMDRLEIDPLSCSNDDISILQRSIVGFDIDPLAVILSKINWVLLMRDYITVASTDLVIPIFHADSLFMITPVSKNMQHQSEEVILSFDGEDVSLPGFLISPDSGILFDHLVNACYSLAMQRSKNVKNNELKFQIEAVVETALTDIPNNIQIERVYKLKEFCCNLTSILEKMQRDGKNGIWAFILENTYRPALVTGQFNGIVSNPPWMAMSKLHDNPYKSGLVSRALEYNIKPGGGAHHHVELATIFLLQSVEHYLSSDSRFACVMPDSLLNGYHHEPFRKEKYRRAVRPIDINTREIWEVDPTTFKNKAIVIFGDNDKEVRTTSVIPGKLVHSDKEIICEYKLLKQGKRSAWSNKPGVEEVTEVLEQIPFLQGADIMPRTVVFHRSNKQPNGKWRLSKINRMNDDLSYLVKDAKKHKDFNLESVNVDDDLMYNCFLSHHVIPFNVLQPADAFLPINRDLEGNISAISDDSLAIRSGSVKSSIRSLTAELGITISDYYDKLNYRNKLNPQKFNEDSFLVLAGAGGSYTCSGYVNLSSFDAKKVIVDQTLYWYQTPNENEAIYIVGLLNSVALDSLIAEFQPEGIQGRRHIHKLPYAITPQYDEENESHIELVRITNNLMTEFLESIDAEMSELISDPSKSTLQVRRRKVREHLKQLSNYSYYEEICKQIYGVDNNSNE